MPQPRKTNVPVEELVQGFTGLLDSGESADLKIECNGQLWAVHSPIICSRSAYFKAACTSGFQETETRLIKLQDETPAMVDRMMSYFYKLDYSDGQSTSQDFHDHSDISPLHTNVVMYAIGEKFGIGGLKKLAEEKFEIAFDSSAETDLTQLLQVITEVYNTTPDTDYGLRALAVTLTTTKPGLYPRLVILPEFKDTVAAVPQFAVDLIVSTAPHIRDGKCDRRERGFAQISDTSGGCYSGLVFHFEAGRRLNLVS